MSTIVYSALAPAGTEAEPDSPLLRTALAAARGDDWVSAYQSLQQAALVPADRRCAHYMLWEACQALGHPDIAMEHLKIVLRENPVTSRSSANPARRVLALAVPGDFQANLPLGALLGAAGTELHTLWLTDPAAVITDPRAALPAGDRRFDCTFVTIAEDARHRAALQAADRLADALGVAAINRGSRIASVSRGGAAEILRDLPGAIVPVPRLLDRPALAAAADFPVIVRPSGAHAGKGLARLDARTDLNLYLETATDQFFYVAPFIDYRSADGFWRKYRVIFVGGRPMPYHLGIHTDWAVWYYNARMDLDAWKRDEEARFTADIAAAFPAPAMAALRALGERVGLDYFGLDCGVMPDGRLLVFEVETGMLVHSWDPPALFPYKRGCAEAIARATEAMIDRAAAAARPGRA